VNVEPSTPVRDLTINGTVFQVPQPYTEGHICNVAEAHALNQTFAENVRNNMAGRMKKAKPGEAIDWTQALAAYIKEYEFALPGERGARVPADPVENEAWKLATKAVVAALKKHNRDRKALPEGHFEKLVQGALDKNPFYRESAQKIVNAQREAAAASEAAVLETI